MVMYLYKWVTSLNINTTDITKDTNIQQITKAYTTQINKYQGAVTNHNTQSNTGEWPTHLNKSNQMLFR